MPFVSQQQAKWAFATKQPWAERWADETPGKISNLPKRVKRKGLWGRGQEVVARKAAPTPVPAVGNASGPGGLFSSAALERKTFVREPRSEIRRRRARITYKEEGHTGVVVALYLPSSAADRVGAAAHALFADRAECPCDLHITLAYLGHVDELEAELPSIARTVQKYVQLWLQHVAAPLEVTLTGYSAFPEATQDDGSVPLWRVVESQALPLFQWGLAQALQAASIHMAREGEPYIPHVTVAYSYPELVELLPLCPATPMTVPFDRVTLKFGDLTIDFPLSMAAYKAFSDDTDKISKPGGGGSGGSKRKPKSELIAPGVYRIRGNLCQVNGKFGPCDAASSEGFNKKPKKPKGAGGGKGGGGKGAKKPTEEDKKAQRAQAAEERRAEAEAQRVQNRTDALGRMANKPTPEVMASLDDLKNGGAGDTALNESLEKQGLVTKHSDGSYTLSANGRALIDALDQGDAGRANEALARGKDQVAAADERKREVEARNADREKKRAERDEAKRKRAAESGSKPGSIRTRPTGGGTAGAPAPTPAPTRPAASTGGGSGGGSSPRTAGGGGSGSGGGGGGGSSKPAAKPSPKGGPAVDARADVQQAVDRVSSAVGDKLEALTDVEAGKTPDKKAFEQLINAGLAKTTDSGKVVLTPSARAVLDAANKGDIKAVLAAIGKGRVEIPRNTQ